MATDTLTIGHKLKADKSWAYSDKSSHDTSYMTHNYYSYPAKFIPQVAKRLIEENSNVGDIVVDCFMGSGTTIVEALVTDRIGIGSDINYVAYLVAKAKTTPVSIKLLDSEVMQLQLDLEHRMNGKYDYYLSKSKKLVPEHERIDYWFRKTQKEKLAIIFARIHEVKNSDIKNFLFVAFAQILKTCSIWLQSSVKPQRDFDKADYEPLTMFLSRVKIMAKRNKELFEKLKPEVQKSIHKHRKISRHDARRIPVASNKAALIVTSPPYVTSYEYADLHQLPSLWFDKMKDINEFRKNFIGSVFKTEASPVEIHSATAEKIIEQFNGKKKAKEIRKYCVEMYDCFKEMKRVLKKNGKACIVIGDTHYRNIDILNHKIFIEQMTSLGFEIEKVILREVTSKMLPSYRDPENGRFAKATDKNTKLVHPKEYIIIAKKK
ncbi:MAG TPA: DNA methyltransferase [Chitinophagaceae bacterium]|nr:DNA methyltransferase [Chitinophagaceae bacterium]